MSKNKMKGKVAIICAGQVHSDPAPIEILISTIKQLDLNNDNLRLAIGFEGYKDLEKLKQDIQTDDKYNEYRQWKATGDVSKEGAKKIMLALKGGKSEAEIIEESVRLKLIPSEQAAKLFINDAKDGYYSYHKTESYKNLLELALVKKIDSFGIENEEFKKEITQFIEKEALSSNNSAEKTAELMYQVELQRIGDMANNIKSFASKHFENSNQDLILVISNLGAFHAHRLAAAVHCNFDDQMEVSIKSFTFNPDLNTVVRRRIEGKDVLIPFAQDYENSKRKVDDIRNSKDCEEYREFYKNNPCPTFHYSKDIDDKGNMSFSCQEFIQLFENAKSFVKGNPSEKEPSPSVARSSAENVESKDAKNNSRT